MKKLLLILDPAHGSETPGKRSPDEKHREFIWSRQRLRAITPRLEALGYQVAWTFEGEREIGLSNRKQLANTYAQKDKTLIPLLISLHNDAITTQPVWQYKASGISVWTSKGRTTSDIFADLFIQNLQNYLPDVKKRVSSHTYLDRDFENDFTVLMGDYSALLIECMFQDNREDVAKLQDPSFCSLVDNWIIDSIEKCNEYVSKNIK